MSRRIQWPRRAVEYWPDVVTFGLGLGLAWKYGWRTTDLLWSTWFSGLIVGYLALLISLGGDWRRRHSLPLGGRWVVGKGLFYSAHFVGLNLLVAYFLPILAPLTGGPGGIWTTAFWSVLAENYWPMLLLTAVTERSMLRSAWQRFDLVGPYLPAVRTWVIYLPLFWIVLLGDVTKLYTVDHLLCYALVALAYFSPWRLGRSEERS